MSAREREIKLLAVSEDHLEAVGRLPEVAGLPAGPATERVQEDVYLDTADFRLLRFGTSLRVRTAGGRVRVTMKEVSGARERPLLADREEIEEDLAAVPPDLSVPPPGEVGRRAGFLLGGRPLRPVARLRTRRSIRRLGAEGGPGALLCLDRVEVRSGEGKVVARFFEVEIEDAGAGEETLVRAGEELIGTHALAASPMSKYERALSVLGVLAGARGPDRSRDTSVTSDLRFVDAAFRVLRKQFDRIRENEAGTRIGEDAEFLHDMRVATRRLRAAFRTFGPCFPERTTRAAAAHFGRLARVLGEVRDLDVYLERMPEYAEMLPEEDRLGLVPFETHLRVRRERARARMLRYLDSERYASLLDRFDRFLSRGAPRRPGLAAARVPVTEAAPRRIRRDLRRVLDCGRKIPGKNPPAEDLHRLRILVKRLRYACEFFGDLYGKRLTRFVRTTVSLQDLLGAQQDAVVAGDVLRAFAARLPVGRRETVKTALALGRLIAGQDLAAIRARAGFRRVFRAFDVKKFRKGMLD